MRATRGVRIGGWAFWLFSAVLIGIWQSQPEIESTLKEGGIDYTVYLGPIWIKLVKDVFVIGLWAYLVLWVKDPFPVSVRRAIAWIYAITAIAFGLASLAFSPLLALAGLRWIIAVFVFLELRRLNGRPFNPRAIALVLLALLAINLTLQGTRLFYFPPVWGERWGLAARVPGFFLLPNTNALFATACAALVIDLMGRTHPLARTALLLAALSALLSQSAGGLIACLVLGSYLMFRRLAYLVPLAAAVGAVFLMASTTLLGRDDFLEYSGGERVEKLATAAQELLSTGAFGAYTNTGFMLAISDELSGNSINEPVISDSFYVSAIGNFGAFALPLAFLFWRALSRASRHMHRYASRLGVASLLCLATFAFSTVVSEAFPMNVMLAIGVWMGSVARTPPRRARVVGETRVAATPAASAGASA